ncbi:MAG TPA: MlaD family protein [Phycisphaerae bacterium]|nr:MlaD family protein [Phycisphaerae bacterium]HRW52803.1 MlaD family protein [Phycisphaerae bacterium]
MAEQHQKTIVGVFALSGLTLLFVLTLLFGGGRTLFERTYDISVRFEDAVDGISTGQPVTLNGKRVGETKAIKFWDSEDLTKGIRIVVAIDDEYQLPSDASVEVAPGLIQFGRPPIRIVLNPAPKGVSLPVDGTGVLAGRVVSMPEQVLPPKVQGQVERVMDEVADLAAALKPVARNLDALLEDRPISSVDQKEMTANFATIVERFDMTLQNFNTILADPDNVENLRITLENARAMSQSGADAMADFREFSAQSKVVAADVSNLMRQLTETSDRLTAVLNHIDQTVVTLNSPKGTMGSLLNDNRLYEELLLSARRLTNALDDMREVLDIAKKGQLRIKAF